MPGSIVVLGSAFEAFLFGKSDPARGCPSPCIIRRVPCRGKAKRQVKGRLGTCSTLRGCFDKCHDGGRIGSARVGQALTSRAMRRPRETRGGVAVLSVQRTPACAHMSRRPQQKTHRRELTSACGSRGEPAQHRGSGNCAAPVYGSGEPTCARDESRTREATV